MTKPFAKAALIGASLLGAPASVNAMTPDDCAAWVGSVFAGVEVTKTAWVTLAGAEICQVSGTRAPYLDIEVVLPAYWRGRSFQLGGGGFDGRIFSVIGRDEAGKAISLDSIVSELGAAYVATNGGNRADVEAEAAPAVWFSGAAGAPGSIEDYAFRAVGTGQAFGAALIDAAYGQPADHRYFMGCSNGGRNAYIAAERYGAHFDGIVAGCEPMDMSSMLANWMSIGRHAGTDAFPTNDQFTWAYEQALAVCDAADGAADRAINTACDFSPSALACTASDDANCLSDEQVATLTEMLALLKSEASVTISQGYNWTDFSEFGIGFGMLGSVYAAIGSGDPSWTAPARQQAYDFDRDHYLMALGLDRQGFGHDMPAIAQYVADGGTLLSWHGAADNLISPKDHAANFQAMTQMAGRFASETDVDVSQRAEFFVVPGATHGRGQHPATNFADAIVAWVEDGRMPSQLTYTREDDGLALPVCPLGQSTAFEAGAYRCASN